MFHRSPETIRSSRNPQFQLWIQWAAHPEDSKCPWLPVEGEKQILELSRDHPIQLLIAADSLPGDVIPARLQRLVRLPDRLFGRLSQVQSSQGMLAFVAKPRWDWKDLGDRIVYLDRIQDPGNLGTIMRSAAATGLFSLVTSEGTVSCFNNKVLRASAGCLFRVPFLQKKKLQEVARQGYRLWVADAMAGRSLYSAEFSTPLALVVGNEGQGISPSKALEEEAQRVAIPIAEGVESLNAGVSASLLMFEVLRREMESRKNV